MHTQPRNTPTRLRFGQQQWRQRRLTGQTRYTAQVLGFCKPVVLLSPNLQRYILTNEAFEDTSEFAEAKYISVHALGGGDFINYQFEKPGDTIQVYGNPLSGDLQASFGIYRIDEITEHNFPDNPDDDGADFSDAFVAYTVTPLATHGVVEQTRCAKSRPCPQWVRSVVALKRTSVRTHRLTPRLAISGIAPSLMI